MVKLCEFVRRIESRTVVNHNMQYADNAELLIELQFEYMVPMPSYIPCGDLFTPVHFQLDYNLPVLEKWLVAKT